MSKLKPVPPAFEVVFSGIEKPLNTRSVRGGTFAEQLAAGHMEDAYLHLKYSERVSGIDIDKVLAPLRDALENIYERISLTYHMGTIMSAAQPGQKPLGSMVETFDEAIRLRLDRYFPKEQVRARG